MPYNSNKDLPKKVSDVLPEHAQDIFRAAFNNAHEEYGNEKQAFKVAWSAVERQYKKDKSGQWVKK
jgi:cation transport regulator